VHNQYLHKGSKVLVEGKLRPDPKTGRPEIWTRQDGLAAADFNVTVKELYFLDSRSNSQTEPPAIEEEVDIPF
jgi:single-strand DNA-binding protein